MKRGKWKQIEMHIEAQFRPATVLVGKLQNLAK